MKNVLTLSLVLLLSTAWTASSAFANHEGGDAKMDPKQQEMMKKWQEFSTPGKEHEMLAKAAGKWKYKSKFWETADGKAQESEGKSTMKMILGGRFLQHETKGKAMGMDFEGLGYTGYDNLKKSYESLWLDNMSTGIMHGTGTYDESTKTLSDSGEASCPMTDTKTRKYRTDWKMVDKNNMTFTMYGPGMDGKEFKQMEIVYKR